DDPGIRLLMRVALEKEGFSVSIAKDGVEALSVFHETACQMVLLDVDMPGMSGFEVCTLLRQSAGDALPIIMVTGHDDVDSIRRAYECGATDFIAKPVNWNLIGHRVIYLWRAYENAVALRKANARNTAVLSAIPDVMFRLGHDGMVLDVGGASGKSSSMQLSPGYRLDYSLPAPIAALYQEAAVRARSSGGIEQIEYELFSVDGDVQHFESRVVIIDAKETLCLVRDITERKRTEIALRRSEALMQQAQSLARLGNWYADLRNNVLEWSPETYRIFGLAQHEPISYERFMACVWPDDRDAVLQAWRQAIRSGRYHIEHRITVSGETRWVVERAELEFDRSGRAVRGIGTVQDITERKEAEQKIFRLAYFDSLTGLPNRQSFLERLD